MILVDSNILIFAAGAKHPHKAPSVKLLEQIANGSVEAVVNTLVLQEILHRYGALNRGADGNHVFDLTRSIFPVVLAIDAETIDLARDILEASRGIAARDAIHAAVVELEGLDGICSYDRDFDKIKGVNRLVPEKMV